VAALIDYSPFLALGILSGLVTMALRPGLGAVGAVSGLGAAAGLGCLLGLLDLALLVGYLILVPLCWMRCRATPGKKIMKLRVVPEGNPAGAIDLSASILRLLGYLVNGIISWLIMVPVGMVLVFLAAPLPHPLPYLVLRIAGLVVGVIPYLLLLGAARKGLEDHFSRSIVIRVDR